MIVPPEAALRAASPQGASALGRPGGAHLDARRTDAHRTKKSNASNVQKLYVR